jgi:predicted nucleotidyltransferase
VATAAIICEYNPFHNGHLHQLALTRAELGTEAGIVCLMSGNYVQRGEPALFDKMVRARAAIDCGASLVLELPVTCALRSAEGFGGGAVDILNRLGCVDVLSFGCECGAADDLQEITAALLSERFPLLLQKHLAEGLPFASARERAVQEMTGLGALLRKPNNILAVEYCKALRRTGSTIRPLALLRNGDYHGGDSAESPSATAVRERLTDGGDWRALVPAEAAACYADAPRHTLAQGERAMLARLRALSDEEWESVPFGTEGLWSKVMKAARAESSVEGILTASLSKRYPRTRLSRLLLCAYLGISSEVLDAPAPYVRVLAFDERGRALLRTAKEHGSIPLCNAGEAGSDAAYATLEYRSADLYTLFSENEPDCGKERRIRVYYKGN